MLESITSECKTSCRHRNCSAPPTTNHTTHKLSMFAILIASFFTEHYWEHSAIDTEQKSDRQSFCKDYVIYTS
jgi:hypothetical protein